MFGEAYKANSLSLWQVVDTDYENYAVVYECNNGFLWLYHESRATVLSRENLID